MVYVVLTVCAQLASGQVYIPNSILKAALLNNPEVNINGDGGIQFSEAHTYDGSLTFNGDQGCINDFTGLEAFTALTALTIVNHPCLEVLNVSSNTSLKRINCSRNSLTALDVTSNIHLSRLSCNRNMLSMLDVSSNAMLSHLNVNHNAIKELDVSQNPLLILLDCSNMHPQFNHIDVSQNSLLRFLECDHNRLTSIDVSANPLLEKLEVDDNWLTSIDVSNNPNLRDLFVHNNMISSLDVSNNPMLDSLDCHNNRVTELNLSAHTYGHLHRFWCHNNELVTLNLRNGSNHRLTSDNFRAFGNHDLECIEVDDALWSIEAWPIGISIDTGMQYCGMPSSTSLDDTESKGDDVVYPNPANDRIYFNVADGVVAYELIDLSGKRVIRGGVQQGWVEVGQLQLGIYALMFITSDSRFTSGRVVIMR